MCVQRVFTECVYLVRRPSGGARFTLAPLGFVFAFLWDFVLIGFVVGLLLSVLLLSVRFDRFGLFGLVWFCFVCCVCFCLFGFVCLVWFGLWLLVC